MSPFVVEVNDAHGRQGVLDVGGASVRTPAYIPPDGFCRGVTNVPDAGVCDLWFGRMDGERLRLHPDERERMENAVCERMNRLPSPVRLLHFNFFTDVVGLRQESLTALLLLQHRAGAGVVEIPRVYCTTGMYEQAVLDALAWQRHTGCGAPLMGIARTADDLMMLERYLPHLGGIGLDCRRLDKPLLYLVRRKLKHQDVRVHAFSFPCSYSGMHGREMPGMVIHWFGVDTVSSLTLSEHVRQHFSTTLSGIGGGKGHEIVNEIRPCLSGASCASSVRGPERRSGERRQRSAVV
ncbi:hypothetical protein L1S32_08585 [Methanogenium sp. S4BF]|uniref:hypothetical protein n=1 Tax=Methanogenium sp. S4BF TaxID=1789226 RepID=UPI0024178782|nr:hypothetical protein [Methanogenium sp. S4BF]WFN33898.1 hypothetical protein L1S32_08585 [Methanogenium sp. S4BF]